MIKNQNCLWIVNTISNGQIYMWRRWMGSLAFIRWIDYCTIGCPGAKIQAGETSCYLRSVKTTARLCRLHSLCTVWAGTTAWFRNLRCCQEKQTKPSRQNKRVKKQARRKTKNVSAVNKRIMSLLSELWRLLYEEGVISEYVCLPFCCLGSWAQHKCWFN